jgi:hypothetical protein
MVGAEAAAIIRAPFALGDAEQLRTLMIGAGFHEVAIRSKAGTVHFPSSDDFLRWQVAGSPLAGPVGQLDEGVRQALIQEVSNALEPFVSDKGLAFPIDGHIATARTAA